MYVIRLFLCHFLFPVLLLFFAPFSSANETVNDILTPQERQWLDAHSGKIIIDRTSENWAPIEGIDKNGEPFGIAVDFYRLIEKKLQFEFAVDQPRPWEERLKMFKTREIHVVNNLQKNASRSKYLLFTDPFIEIQNVIIVRKEKKDALTLAQMGEMKVTVTRNFAIHHYIKNNYDSIDLIPVNNDLTALLHVATQLADATVMNVAVASYLIEENSITNLRIAGNSGYTNSLRIASRKDWPILNSVLNKGLSLITQKERKAIRDKWIRLDWVPFYQNTSFRMIVVFLLIIVMISFFWNRQLRKEIAERRHAQDALKKSEALYRTLVENTPGANYRCAFDSQWTMELIGDEIQEISGYPASDFIRNKNRTFASIIHPDDAGALEEDVVKNINAKEKFTLEYRIIGSNGQIRWVLEKGQGIFDDQGSVTHLDGIIFDNSEQKKAQKEREELIKKLEETLEEVKTLGGLLPICAKCKKIRDDKGYWNILEAYIEKHSEAYFSHGLCPDCSDKFYGKEDWYIKMKKDNGDSS